MIDPAAIVLGSGDPVGLLIDLLVIVIVLVILFKLLRML